MPRFFGLTSISKEDLFLTEIDFLIDHKGMDYWTIYTLPVRIRKWFVEKTLNKIQKEQITQDNHNQRTQVLSADNPNVQHAPAEAKRKSELLRSFQENIKNR